MTKLKLMCFHASEGDEEEALYEMEMEEVPDDLPFIELVFVCPKCRKSVILSWDVQRLGDSEER